MELQDIVEWVRNSYWGPAMFFGSLLSAGYIGYQLGRFRRASVLQRKESVYQPPIQETDYHKGSLSDARDEPLKPYRVFAKVCSLDVLDVESGYAGRFTDEGATMPFYIDIDEITSTHEEEGLAAILLKDALEKKKIIEFCGEFDSDELVFAVDCFRYMMDNVPYEIGYSQE